MQNPTAKITFEDGSVLTLELYPDIAPHAVASFLTLAQKGVFDHYPIERVVPGWVVDVSYHAFHDPRACYFIPNDTDSGRFLPAQLGTIGLGGYDKPYIAGGEFFFPLADAPAITGTYPIFGKVTGGIDILRRLEQAETYPVPFPDHPDVAINTPARPVFIDTVTVDTHGQDYPPPPHLASMEKPLFWPTLLDVD